MDEGIGENKNEKSKKVCFFGKSGSDDEMYERLQKLERKLFYEHYGAAVNIHISCIC